MCHALCNQQRDSAYGRSLSPGMHPLIQPFRQVASRRGCDTSIQSLQVQSTPSFAVLSQSLSVCSLRKMASRGVFGVVSRMQPLVLPRICINPPFRQTRSFGIQAIDRPFRHNPYNKSFNLLSGQRAAYERKLRHDSLPLRTGALAIKRGMTAVYDSESGERIPCTVLQLEQNQVLHHKTMKPHGYYAVCVGAGEVSEKNVTKPQLGHFSAQGVAPKRHLQEFRVRDEKGLLRVGERITADWFMVGQYVDARADCKGKGFAGVMKRWGFGGQPRSHGHSLSHRSLGSTGNGQGGGSRVYPGKKMPGNMGGQQVTTQSLKVVQINPTEGLVLVKGKQLAP